MADMPLLEPFPEARLPCGDSSCRHASLLTTSVDLHVAVDDDGELGSLFEFGSR
jgi:hypothetical protein